METNFDYNLVPHNYPMCINHTCQRAHHCLRYQVYQLVPSHTPFINLVNPKELTPDGVGCSHFKPDQQEPFALGITLLYDHLPHAAAKNIKADMLNYFGKTMYYRFQRKERYISPSQQRYIKQLFQNAGIANSPVFDEYCYRYEW